MVCESDTFLLSNCTGFNHTRLRELALIRGATGMVCFFLCLLTFLLEMIFICSKGKSTTLQRLLMYLTIATLLYTGALSLQIEHYFRYNQRAQCDLCTAVGVLTQYSGSVQLLLTLSIVAKLVHTVSSLCCATKEHQLSRNHLKFEVLLVIACFVLPCSLIWIPFVLKDGIYGEFGSWCWITTMKRGCHFSKNSFLEELLLWYVPFIFVSTLTLIIILTILILLLAYTYFYHTHKVIRGKVRTVLTETLLLLPFCIIFCCVCITEVTIVVFYYHNSSNYIMWMFYAFSAPIGGITMPIAFFMYFLRMRNSNKPKRCHHSIWQKIVSYTSQQKQLRSTNRSQVDWETSKRSIEMDIRLFSW